MTSPRSPRRLCIGVDASCLDVARTGVRTYVDEVLPAMQAAGRHDIVLLRPSPRPPARDAFGKALRHARHQHWMQVALPAALRRERCDVLLGPDYEVPLRAPCPTVPVFHDANFWLNPQQYSRPWRALMDVTAVRAARRSARVLTDSEAARRDLVRLLGLDTDRVRAVHLAAKPMGSTGAGSAAELAQAGLRAGGYLLHVGVLEKRKNLPRLVEAFAAAGLPDDVRLVLAGQPGPKRDLDDSPAIHAAVARLGLGERVLFPGFVSSSLLAALYRHAIATVFPSLLEGFGLPVLEAYQFGSPLACSTAGSVPEVAGDAALFFDPLDTAAIAAAIRRMHDEPGLRADLARRGAARARAFTWDRTAAETLDALEEAAAC